MEILFWNPSLDLVVAIDVITVVVSMGLAIRFARLGHSHPATIYYAFHLLVVTFRLVSLSLGADPLFTPTLRTSFYEPVTMAEITRASLVADVALVFMTLAWIRAARYEATHFVSVPENVRRLELRFIKPVIWFFLPLGIAGLALVAANPLVEAPPIDFGDWSSSGWLGISQTWPGLVLLALIYWYGFRRPLVVAMALYLLVMVYQGFHRFRFIIPVLLLCEIYLDRRRLRWPSAGIAALLLAVALLFFPLKTIGRMAQEGASVDEIASESRTIIRNAFTSDGEMQLLDEFAAALSQIDGVGKRYLGTGYLSILTLPIPRQWWPDKPGLADYLTDISSPRRPMAASGMVISVWGEAYLNFGYVGVVAIAYLLAYWLSRAYFAAYRRPYDSVARFAYLLVACNLIQVYRDGLMSIAVFTLVYMMPLSVIVALHYGWPGAVPAVSGRPLAVIRRRRCRVVSEGAESLRAAALRQWPQR